MVANGPLFDLLSEAWRFEARENGVYVAVEEIGGQGELGPFADLPAARIALLGYWRDERPDPLTPRLTGRTD
jgi:hypothetical protein